VSVKLDFLFPPVLPEEIIKYVFSRYIAVIFFPAFYSQIKAVSPSPK
jgi:hypothetical protein